MDLMSQLLLPTLRNDPNDAETTSHRWMLRAGLIRKVAAGIYNMLPAGLKVQRKVETIIREELNAAGAQELLMPAVIPAELWQESGRWEQYGPELLRIKDRHKRDFVIGPTHEEVITDIVRSALSSYKQLPVNLYQIQAKFRDEVRPRFGVMRGREFIMKDAYSFHYDLDSLHETYTVMSKAYSTIFARTGLAFAIVDADAGNIGGDASQEFMVLADSGEDEIVTCTSCSYAANVEKAKFAVVNPPSDKAPVKEEVHTPGKKSIEEVSTFLKIDAARLMKTLVYETDSGVVMVVLAGNRQVQETKLINALGGTFARMLEDEEILKETGAPVGYLGPIATNLPLFVDQTVASLDWGVTGANKTDYHLTGISAEMFPSYTTVDIATTVAGDTCSKCNATLASKRGIEVGHIFKLGNKYSKAMNATVLDENGEARILEMGCYGIGVTRTMAAAIEQNNDERGICWPWSIAPWHAHILALDWQDTTCRETVEKAAAMLEDLGCEVLVDNREERPGVKFNDADILGCPLQIIAGRRGLEKGIVEYKIRSGGERGEIQLDALEQTLQELTLRLRT